MTPSFRGVSAQNFAEKLRENSASSDLAEKKSGLRELTRNLANVRIREFLFAIFVRGVNAKKEHFFLGWTVYISMHIQNVYRNSFIYSEDIGGKHIFLHKASAITYISKLN